MFVRGEGDQYPPIGKRGHPPLQAFLGPGCSGTNTRTHFTQFLLSLFGGDMDVLGDAFRSRFFGAHGFILSQLARTAAPSALASVTGGTLAHPSNRSPARVDSGPDFERDNKSLELSINNAYLFLDQMRQGYLALALAA